MNGFRFNTDKFDFWPIYEAIKKYYPIGVEIDPEFYRSYSGHAELINILSEKVHNDENYTSIWTNFENKLALNTGKTVITDAKFCKGQRVLFHIKNDFESTVWQLLQAVNNFLIIP